MINRSIIPVLATVFALFAISLLLFSVKIAIVVFGGGIIVIFIFFHPFYGLLIYLMMTYLRPQEFIPALRDKPLMLVLAGVIFGSLALHIALEKKSINVMNTRQSVFMLVFFLLIPLSHLQNAYLTGAQESFSDFLPVFLLFYMILNFTINSRQLEKCFYLLFWMTLLLSLNGILQHFRGYDIAGQTMFQGRIRWIGIFDDPNDLGLTILTFTPIAILNLFSTKNNIIKQFLWVLALTILITALYFTNSRGTFIGLLAIMVTFLCKRIGVVKGLMIGSVLSVAVLAFGPSRMSEMSLGEASAGGRIDAWATGLNLLKWRPILGVGYHNFTEHHHLTAHNSVVLCMSELGLTGLFVWLLLLVSSFKEMIYVEKFGVGTKFALYAQVLQLSLIGFFVSGFFLSRTYNEVLYIIIALCSLMSFFGRKKFDYKLPLLSKSLLISTLIFMVGLIVLIKIFVSI